VHEISLGGAIRDYLSGEERELTTYEDLRQALARYLVEERGYDPSRLRSHYPVAYEAAGEKLQREADVVMLLASGDPGLLLVFCPGQINTYVREVLAMARLCPPLPCPLAVVTDMRDAKLLAVKNGAELARGLASLPDQPGMETLAGEHALEPLNDERREKEGRILHTYTGFLKNCCGESCKL
jgi:hypothetical protein